MMDYIITTDNMGDLPEQLIEQYQLPIMSLSYLMDGQVYTRENSLPYQEFYKKMRAGSMPTTSQINPQEAKEKFLEFMKINKKLIHIAFSGGLSGTYSSVKAAAEELMQEVPDCKITVIDSLSASLGEGLLVYHALQKQREGMDYDEMVEWIETHKKNMVHNFTVDDLFHLSRGGRVSKTAALLGTMVSIKPLLHVDNEGHLVPVGKVRGRRNSIAAMVESMKKQIGSWKDKNPVVFISHGDCLEDAALLKSMIEKELNIHSFMIGPVGPTIGAHSGPGTLALFYLGDVR